MTLAAGKFVRYLISPGELNAGNYHFKKRHLIDTIRQAADLGIELVQIREKNLTARALFDLASEAVAATRGTNTRILVNDRCDIAVAAKSDGVHLPAASFAAATVRETFGRRILIGVSAHTFEDVAVARACGADFAVFGPIFAVPGKGKGVGIEALAQVCAQAGEFPVIAIGGIDADCAGEVAGSGAVGFASIRFLNSEAGRKLAADLDWI